MLRDIAAYAIAVVSIRRSANHSSSLSLGYRTELPILTNDGPLRWHRQLASVLSFVCSSFASWEGFTYLSCIGCLLFDPVIFESSRSIVQRISYIEQWHKISRMRNLWEGYIKSIRNSNLCNLLPAEANACRSHHS